MLGRLLPVLALILPVAHGSVFLITRDNVSFVFEDADAAFGGMIPPVGMQGVLQQAIPYDGCSPFDQVVEPGAEMPRFALIMRGNCQFDVKVLNAQLAGYSAAVIYNNEDSPELITMSGRHLWDIYIPAVFVTRNAGKQMLSLTEQLETVCFLTPAFDNTAWSILTASFLSLLALCSVLTLFMYIRRARLREIAVRMLEREPVGMSAREVKALPEVVFCQGAAECEGLETCAICLDDYEEDDTLRLLPCKHGFHAACIDQWLTSRSPCCPVCKRDCTGDSGESSSGGHSRSSSGEGQTAQRNARLQRLLQVSIMGVPIPARMSFLSLFGHQGSLEDPLLSIVIPPAEPSGPADEATAAVRQREGEADEESAPILGTASPEQGAVPAESAASEPGEGPGSPV